MLLINCFKKNKGLLLVMNSETIYLPLEHSIGFIERVQCSHWNEQHIVVALSSDRVAKLTPENDDRLIWERRFVRRILNYLLDNNITPCLTRYVGTVRCEPNAPYGKLLWRHIQRSEQDTAQRAHQSPMSPSPAPSPLSLGNWGSNSNSRANPALVGFVVERAAGVPMHQWAKHEHSLQQWRYVLFQLFYTFATFNDIGLHHNDMHLENIFVDERGWPQPQTFSLADNKTVTIPSSREAPAVRFIDFDKASLSKSRALPGEWQSLLDTNPTLENELCTSYGLCNHHGARNEKFDAFTLLCSLLHGVAHYQYKVPTAVQKWIKEEAMPRGKRLYNADFEAQGGFLCRLSHHFDRDGDGGGSGATSDSYVPNDDEQRPTEYILQRSSLFQPLIGEKTGNANVFRRPVGL